MSLTDNKRKKEGRVVSTIVDAASMVADQVPLNRQEESYILLAFLINGRPTQEPEYKERQLPEGMVARPL